MPAPFFGASVVVEILIIARASTARECRIVWIGIRLGAWNHGESVQAALTNGNIAMAALTNSNLVVLRTSRCITE